jgi:hypothetical protein
MDWQPGKGEVKAGYLEVLHSSAIYTPLRYEVSCERGVDLLYSIATEIIFVSIISR